MIKLKDLLIESMSFKWIIGYIDSYGKVHYKVIKHNDVKEKHSDFWGIIPKKWRYWPSNNPNEINSYGADLDDEEIESIWNVIEKFK